MTPAALGLLVIWGFGIIAGLSYAWRYNTWDEEEWLTILAWPFVLAFFIAALPLLLWRKWFWFPKVASKRLAPLDVKPTGTYDKNGNVIFSDELDDHRGSPN